MNWNWFDNLIVGAILILLAVLILGPKAKAAEDVPVMVFDAKEEGMVARFFTRPCDDPRLVTLFRSARPDLELKDADSVFRMRSGEWRPYAGCWAELTKEEAGLEAILFIAEDGDYFVLDKAKFQRGTGT